MSAAAKTPLALLLAAQAEFYRETLASLSSFAGAASRTRDPLQLAALQVGLLTGMAERSLLLGRQAALLALGGSAAAAG